MANIEYGYIPGRSLYAVDELAGQFWNTNTVARESYNASHWAQYAIALTEYSGSGIYAVSYPSSIPAGQLATQIIYQQNGVSPLLPSMPGGDSFLSIGQSQGTNLLNINGNYVATANLALSAGTIVTGAAVTGTLSTTQMSTNLINANNGAYVGRTIIWTSGSLANIASGITGYLVTNGLLTYTAVPVAPAPADTFILV